MLVPILDFSPGWEMRPRFPDVFPLMVWVELDLGNPVGSLIEEPQPVAPLLPQKCSRGTATCISSTLWNIHPTFCLVVSGVCNIPIAVRLHRAARIRSEGKQTVLPEQIIHSLEHPKPLIREQPFHTHPSTIPGESILIRTLGCINIWPVREPRGRAEGRGELQLEIQ